MFLLLLLSSSCLLCVKSTLFLFIFMSLQAIGFVSLLSNSNSHKIGISYYIPSVIGGLLWLVGSFCYPYMPYLIFFSLSLKLGLFPFTGWAVTVCLGLLPHQLFFFLGPLKVGLLYLIIFSSPVCVPLSFLSFVFGLVMLSLSSSLVLILLSSSLVTFFYFIFISPFAFTFYLCTYLVTLLLLCGCPGLEVSLLTALLGLAGLPPFSLFWGKLLVLGSLPSPLSLCFLFLSGLCLPSYLSYLGCLLHPRSSSPAGLLLPPSFFVLTFMFFIL